MPNAETMTVRRNHVLFWAAAFLVFLALTWLFKSVMLPFVLGAAVAYLLDPLAEKLARRGVSRTIAALLVLAVFFVFVVAVLALVLPFAYREAVQFIDAVPSYVEKIGALAAPYTGWLHDRFGNGDPAAFENALKNNISSAFKVGGSVLAGLAVGGQALAGFLSVMILTPLTAFFMIREWPQITGWIDNQIPRKNYKIIKNLLAQINAKVAGFVRGQLSIAFVLALIYAVALLLAGLNFGFLIGLMAGLLSIVPLVGSTVGLLVSIGMAWLQSGEWGYVGIIAAIFIVGQFVEGNILTPRLLGKSVGMHPLWILFVLMAGGSAFGIVGMLLAVPVAASLGVLVGFAFEQYRQSDYYKAPVSKKTAKTKNHARDRASTAA